MKIILSSEKKEKMKEGLKKMDETIQKFVSFVEEINNKSKKGGIVQEKKGNEKR